MPAAVISIGKNLPSDCAAASVAAVAGDDRLGRQGVHRLRASRARDHLHRETRDAPIDETLDQVLVRERLEESDQESPLAHEIELVAAGRRLARLTHLQHRVRASEQLGRPRHDRGAGFGVLAVAAARLLSGARLDRHLEARLRELGHDGGHERYPALARDALSWDADPQSGA